MASKLKFTPLAMLLLAAVATAQAVTQATVTSAPVTQAPVTQAPVTQAPVTQAPVTQAPVTQAPVTQAPVTQAPVTQAPVTTLSPADVAAIAAIGQIQGNITTSLTAACCQANHVTTFTAAVFAATTRSTKCTTLQAGLNACETTGLDASCPTKLAAIKDLTKLDIVCGSCSLIQASTLLMSLMAVTASLWSGRM